MTSARLGNSARGRGGQQERAWGSRRVYREAGQRKAGQRSRRDGACEVAARRGGGGGAGDGGSWRSAGGVHQRKAGSTLWRERPGGQSGEAFRSVPGHLLCRTRPRAAVVPEESGPLPPPPRCWRGLKPECGGCKTGTGTPRDGQLPGRQGWLGRGSGWGGPVVPRLVGRAKSS